MSDIKKEFEKAFDDAGIEPNDPWTPKQIALWAARWAMERCAKITMDLASFDDSDIESAKSARSFVTATLIRQQSKEL